MKESKLLYAMTDHEDFMAVMWETDLEKILVCNGGINNLNSNICIRDANGIDLVDVDLRNVIMSILPSN